VITKLCWFYDHGLKLNSYWLVLGVFLFEVDGGRTNPNTVGKGKSKQPIRLGDITPTKTFKKDT
jgi:hypothetical protein